MRPTSLDVWFNGERVGTVSEAQPLAFSYAPQWLQRSQPMALAAIELVQGDQSGAGVQAFFENLLPEGDQRDWFMQRTKASTLFSLLLELAGDTAGSFVLLPTGQTPGQPTYAATTWEALGNKLKEQPAAMLGTQGKGTRISLAGAQDKASVAIFDGVPMLPQGVSPSTHILKPDIRRLPKVWESAANEAIIMRAAALCGLPTAEVFYEPHTHACVVTRFDRYARPDGSLGRLIQYDFCQLSSTVSGRKYEKEGGPGIAESAALIRRYSSQTALDLRNFVAWIFFNLYTGNNDSHAKNLSVFYTPERGVRLTPFYDLMCTRLYPGLSQEFAFSIGGEVNPGGVGPENVALMSQAIGIQPSFAARIAAQVATQVPAAMRSAIASLQPDLAPRARILAERLEFKVNALTRQTTRRLQLPGA